MKLRFQYTIMKRVGIINLLVMGCFLLPLCKTADVPRLNNIGFLGMGYDVIRGNPQGSGNGIPLDPGFAGVVFDLTYNEKSTTSDGKYLVPDKVQALQTVSCTYDSESVEITGSSSYQDTLSVDASVEGDRWGMKFSASAGYKNTKEGTSNSHKTYVSTTAICIVYTASIRKPSPIKVSTEFAQAVKDLPLVRNDGEYTTFISIFGTHYVTKMLMGAKSIMTSEFEQMAWTTLTQEGVNVKVGAQGSYLGVTSVGVATDKKNTEAFESKRSNVQMTYVGSTPSNDGKWETWAATAGERPYPISYTLSELTELFTPNFFPSISASDLATKQKLLTAAYTVYCNSLPNCGVPSPDRPPVMMDLIETTINGHQQVSCRPGYSLLSCGSDNSQKDHAEYYRHSVPANLNTCDCYDYYGMRCTVWCGNSAQGTEIVTSPNQKGTFGVQCPAGKKVLGCHMNQPERNQEVFGAFYPNNDGSGCTCYHYFGAQCVATCASNIINNEIRMQYGEGSAYTQVTCSPKNYVLGCGIKPKRGGGHEKWRTMSVVHGSLNSCNCYDYKGSTCYAVCGQFK